MLRNVTGLDPCLLRIFARVMKCDGFTVAQAELDTSQPSISIHTANLEERLSYRFCEYGRGGLRLTARGRRTLETSRTMSDVIGLFRDQAQVLSGRLVGELYLSLANNLATLPQARFGDTLTRFRRRDQNVRLNLFMNPSTEPELAVTEDELNLAIFYFNRSQSSLEYCPLYREEIDALCDDRHPLFAEVQPTLEQIAACDWVMHGFLPENLALPLCPSRSCATAYHMEVVARIMLASTHLGYLSTRYAEAWTERGRIYALLLEQLSYPVEHSMIVYARRPLSEAVRAFIDDLLQVHGLGA